MIKSYVKYNVPVDIQINLVGETLLVSQSCALAHHVTTLTVIVYARSSDYSDYPTCASSSLVCR